jgi:uncharacterized protein
MRRDGTFDAYELAARGQSIGGTLEAATLARAADRLAEGQAAVAWRVVGTADALGRPALEVSLDGSVPLECQRCLRTFAWPVAQKTLLLLARDDRELARLDAEDEHEVVVAAAPLPAAALVEDELLLTLPFAPHCGRDDCAMATSGAEGGTESEPAHSPFGALAALKAGRTGKQDA